MAVDKDVSRETEESSSRWPKVSTRFLIVVTIAAAALLIPLGFILGKQGSEAQQGRAVAERRSAAVEVKAKLGQSLADQVLDACRRGGTLARPLAQQGLCRQANAVQVQSPVAKSAPGVARVNQADVNRAVDEYLRAHPPPQGKPDLTLVAAAVTDYLVKHPPPDGRSMQTEILSATVAYVASHPDQFRGLPGADASEEQIALAVANYCALHEECRGVRGETGLNGISFVDLNFQRNDDGQCMSIVTLYDSNTGIESTKTHEVGDAACRVTPDNNPLGN